MDCAFSFACIFYHIDKLSIPVIAYGFKDATLVINKLIIVPTVVD